MTNERQNKTYLSEYEIFLKSEAAPVPQDVTSGVFHRLKPHLHPSVSRVFVKIMGIHLIVGFLSLSVCHQFGINPFGTIYSLDNWFMKMWGHGTCMVLCGIIFVGASFLTAGLFLSMEEVLALKKQEWTQSFLVAGASLIIFFLAGADLALAFAALWLLGALCGGFLATQTLWQLRRSGI